MRISNYPGWPATLSLAILLTLSAGAVLGEGDAERDPYGEQGIVPDALPEDEPDGLHQELNEAFRSYKKHYESGHYERAIEEAKRVIVLSIEANGRQHLQTARALTNLAIAQQKSGDYEAAQQNYLAAIDIVETVDSRLSKHLVNPLRGLGNTYLDAGRPDQAIGVYDRAVHLTHVNSGPQNLEQVDLLEALSESFLRLRDLKEAENVQELSYQLYQRRYGDEDPEILPAMLRRARWLHRLGLFTEERYIYLQVIDILEEAHGEDDTRLIGPLNGLARTYLYDVESAPSNRGEWALKRAVDIAENDPDGSPLLVADTLIAQGDYHGLRGEAQKARRAYRSAWNLLGENEEFIDQRDARFGEPVQIRRAVPSAYADDATDPTLNPVFRAREFDRGSVLVEFTVNSRGRTEDIEIIESEPPGVLDDEVKKAVRRFVFRPRFEGGEPVTTPGRTFRHAFSYIPERLPEEIRSADSADDGEDADVVTADAGESESETETADAEAEAEAETLADPAEKSTSGEPAGPEE